MLKRSALTTALCGLAFAITTSIGNASPPQRPSSFDITFADKFMGAGNTEIALAKIAQQKSKNRAVLAFAAKMIADHTKAGDALTKLTTKQSISLPQVTSDQLARLESQLNAAPSPKAFDAQYKADNVMGHAEALQILNSELSSGSDADLKAYAKAQLPIVQQHARLARSLPAN